MKLVASMLVHNERHRYLDLALASLLEFCEEVRVLDDGSTDGWHEDLHALGVEGERVSVKVHERSTFFDHEGTTRQDLYSWTLAAEPTHILAIDADEFVTNGSAVRAALTGNPEALVWGLWLDEIWAASEECLCIRVDGSWGNRSIGVLYRVMPDSHQWKIANRALACGREPQEVLWSGKPWPLDGAEILHFGWTREEERIARHARYAEHDQGNFHARRHLDSILQQPHLVARDWPDGLPRTSLLDRLQHPVKNVKTAQTRMVGPNRSDDLDESHADVKVSGERGHRSRVEVEETQEGD